MLSEIGVFVGSDRSCLVVGGREGVAGLWAAGGRTGLVCGAAWLDRDCRPLAVGAERLDLPDPGRSGWWGRVGLRGCRGTPEPCSGGQLAVLGVSKHQDRLSVLLVDVVDLHGLNVDDREFPMRICGYRRLRAVRAASGGWRSC